MLANKYTNICPWQKKKKKCENRFLSIKIPHHRDKLTYKEKPKHKFHLRWEAAMKCSDVLESQAAD